MIKSEIVTLERIATQCVIEKQSLELSRCTTNSVLRNKHETPATTSNEEQHEAFKPSICRVCKLLVPGPYLKPTSHRVTRKGFPVKDECPHIFYLSRSERSKVLKKNKICRSCLSLKIDTGLHGGEGSCRHLERKNLLHLKCEKEGCLLRKSLCDHSQSKNSLQKLCKSQNVETINNLSIQSQQSDISESTSGTTTNWRNGDISKEFIETVGRNKAITEDNSHENTPIMSVEVAADQSIDEETSHSVRAFKGGTICSEIMTMKRKSLMKQSKEDHRALYSNVIVSTDTLVSAHQRKSNDSIEGRTEC